jgi:hypothetical protein
MAAVVGRTWRLIDAEAVGVVVAAIALVDVGAPDLDACVPLDVGDGAFQRVAVEGIAVQRALACRTNWPPVGRVTIAARLAALR